MKGCGTTRTPYRRNNGSRLILHIHTGEEKTIQKALEISRNAAIVDRASQDYSIGGL
jgi:hypothetical protein